MRVAAAVEPRPPGERGADVPAGGVDGRRNPGLDPRALSPPSPFPIPPSFKQVARAFPKRLAFDPAEANQTRSSKLSSSRIYRSQNLRFVPDSDFSIMLVIDGVQALARPSTQSSAES